MRPAAHAAAGAAARGREAAKDAINAAKAKICPARRPGVMFGYPAGALPLPAAPYEGHADGGGVADAGHLHMPVMPPGAIPPAPGRSPHRAAGLVPPGVALGPRAASSPRVGDYQEAYRSLVAGLAGGGRSLVPPGHPLYSRIDSAAALRAENEALRKEVADLRALCDAGAGSSNSGQGAGRRHGHAAPGPQSP